MGDASFPVLKLVRKWASMSAPLRLVSLWDMLQLDSDKFLRLMRNLHYLDGSLGLVIKGRSHVYAIDERLRSDAAELADLCKSLGLTYSSKQAKRFIEFCATEGDVPATDAAKEMRIMSDRIKDEFSVRTLLVLDEHGVALYQEAEPFGPEVFKSFPSANEDLAEASKCLGLERSTACVMHLMRVAEAGLKCLAKALRVKTQNDWGAYLKEIDKALTVLPKTTPAKSSTAASRRQQFFAEASLEFRSLKRAWRNPTMHVARTYTLSRAEEIFQAMRSFMRHLATTVHE